METSTRYGLISDSPLEFLISFVLKNTCGTKLFTHIKERFDNHSCCKLFRKLTGNFFFFRLVILMKYLWKGSFLGPETFQKCELCHRHFSKTSNFLLFYGTLLSGCYCNFNFLKKGALHWLLHGFCTPETTRNVLEMHFVYHK